MTFQVKHAEFVLGAFGPKELSLPAHLPEIAFIGRSNVGKSTLINRLTNRKGLAKTSSTPGRTQQFNFFEIRGTDSSGRHEQFYFVDLPGFGYAKFSKKRREKLSSLIVDYVHGRDELKVICLLNDCRRIPEAEELALRDLAFDAGKHCLVIATKVDKPKKRNELRSNIGRIAESYELEAEDLVLSGEKKPTQEFWERVLPLLD